MANASARGEYALDYRVCRNISAPEDDAEGRKVYSGHAPISSMLDLDDNENVREYLVDVAGKQKHSPTLVHQAIRKTLRDHPDQFSILNGGMVIVARSARVDDDKKTIYLDDPSIINGSQTQGELKRYFTDRGQDDVTPLPSVKFEIIVTTDPDLVAEISIARNFQNDVRAISIAGRRGQLDELEERMQEVFPSMRLRKSETNIVSDGGAYLDTEKLIQVTFAVMPEAMLGKIDRLDASNKVFTYSQKTRCLRLFQKLVEAAPSEAYDAFLRLAPVAWRLYEHWKAHQGFIGTRIRSITREDGRIVDVPDGVIFPILASYAEFATHAASGWVITTPPMFSEDELIDTAKQAYMEIADSNPQTMGKSKACYTALARITSIYARLAKR